MYSYGCGVVCCGLSRCPCCVRSVKWVSFNQKVNRHTKPYVGKVCRHIRSLAIAVSKNCFNSACHYLVFEVHYYLENTSEYRFVYNWLNLSFSDRLIENKRSLYSNVLIDIKNILNNISIRWVIKCFIRIWEANKKSIKKDGNETYKLNTIFRFAWKIS